MSRVSTWQEDYVSEPTVISARVQVYVDCKGVIEAGVAATFRRT